MKVECWLGHERVADAPIYEGKELQVPPLIRLPAPGTRAPVEFDRVLVDDGRRARLILVAVGGVPTSFTIMDGAETVMRFPDGIRTQTVFPCPASLVVETKQSVADQGLG